MSTRPEPLKKPAGTKAPEHAVENEELLAAAQHQGSGPEELLHALKTTEAPSPKSVLMLQRTYGNRATAQMLTRSQPPVPAHPPTPIHASRDAAHAVQRETVTKRQEELAPDGSVAYGWNYQYSVRFTPFRCILSLKVKLTPAPHPDTGAVATDDDVAEVCKQSREQFARIWDNEFLLVETGTNKKYSLRTDLEFVTSGEDLSVALYKGQGRDNRRNWYTETDDGISRAHELGHQLGLLDEYEDPGVEKRKDSSASGVHSDHSAMGNYEVEGFDEAEAKLRHGQHIAKDISDATGRGFSAVKPGRIEMFFRKLLW